MAGRQRVEVHMSPAHLAFAIREQRNSKGDLIGLLLGEEREIVREELTDTDQPRTEKKTVLMVRSFQPWDVDTLLTSFDYQVNQEVIDLITDGRIQQLIGWFSYKPCFLALEGRGQKRSVVERKRCMTFGEKQIHERLLALVPEKQRQHFVCGLFTSRAAPGAGELDHSLISSSHDYIFLYAHNTNMYTFVPASLHIRTKESMSDSGQFVAKPTAHSSPSSASKSSASRPSSQTTNNSNKYYTITPAGISKTSIELQRIMSGKEGHVFRTWMSDGQASIVNSITSTCDAMSARAEVLSQMLVKSEHDLSRARQELDLQALIQEKIIPRDKTGGDGEAVAMESDENEADIDTQLIDFNGETSSEDMFNGSASEAAPAPATVTQLIPVKVEPVGTGTVTSKHKNFPEGGNSDTKQVAKTERESSGPGEGGGAVKLEVEDTVQASQDLKMKARPKSELQRDPKDFIESVESDVMNLDVTSASASQPQQRRTTRNMRNK